tara:strand:- start:7922 stop:9163 length:1242 start_codon:yes stop_codon:yes gene_type:complete
MKNLAVLVFSICLFSVAPIAAQNAKTATDYSNHIHNGVSNNQFIHDEYRANQFVPFSNSLRYNRVDGLFLGIGSDIADDDFGPIHIEGLTIKGQLGYSTNLKQWQYRAGAYKQLGNALKVGAQIINVSTTDDGWRTNQIENSVTSLISGYDYHDYYKAEGFQLVSELNLGRYIQVSGSYNATSFSSLVSNQDYSLFKGGNLARINPAIDSSTDSFYQDNFGASLTINKRPSFLRTFSTKLELKTELADIGKLKNPFSYNKYQITSTNYLKLDRSTVLKTRTMVGSITGSAPDFKQFALGGIGTMRASGYKFYTGNKMVLNNTELIFGRFNSLSMKNIETEGVHLSIFLDSGWTTNYASAGKDPFSGFDTFAFSELSHNVGAGIGFGILRFELATPIANSQGYTSLWVRLNPTF